MTQSNIANFFKQDSDALANMLAKLKRLKQWNSWINECLPSETILTEHCRIVALDGASLIVIADNPHWVTRFRFFIPELLIKLRNYPELKNIRAICCKVKPPQFNTPRKKQRLPLKISAHTSDIILETAKKVRDEKLREVLERMAGRYQRDDDL